jgi:site-specific DNA recombinase
METQYINNLGVKTEIPQEKIKYVLYARKSTESDEKQALSIESQVKEMLQIAEKENLDVIDIRREAHSAKDSDKRPIFKEILEDIESNRFNAILTWAPDRLSRNAGDLGSLVDLMDQKKLIEIRTHGQTFSDNPNEKFLLMILCSQAKLENDNKSINVKRGLKTRVEMGLWPGPAPTGYLKDKSVDKKCHCIIDERSAPIIKQMFEKVAYEKWSGRKIYHWLKFDLNFKSSSSGKHLSLGNIFRLLQTPFYYGRFEYPKDSGNWYKGKHKPIITKELFDEVQKQVKTRILKFDEPKEFAFAKMITCGLCGSSVCAEEKFKKLKDGSVNRHVYYGCSKSKDKNCKCGYINEKDLIKQFQDLIDKVDLNQIKIQTKIKKDILRFKKFQRSLLNQKTDIKLEDIDIKKYVKFVLKDGSTEDKRNILNSFKNKIIIENKKVDIIERANPPE